jgi:group I intron endonuclease
MPELFYLYQYRHKDSNKRYIGVTCRLERRLKAHARGQSSAVSFNRAVIKYGIDAFEYSLLAIFDDPSAANYHEQAAILKFNTLAPNGYNLLAGAPYTSYRGPLSAESRAQLSASKMGHGVSDESRVRMSLAHKGQKPANLDDLRTMNIGRVRSVETRAKMSAAKMGHSVSDEARAKLSARIYSDETRAKMRDAKLGRKVSAETRAKISAAGAGRVVTAETRAKISATKLAKRRGEDSD